MSASTFATTTAARPTATVRYTESQLAWARKAMLTAKNAEQERAALAPVIGRLYHWAGRQSPIYADKGGNYADDANARLHGLH